jgi:hypothetical protein
MRHAETRPTETARRLQRVIDRYRRDIALLRGDVNPVDLRHDDAAAFIWAPPDDVGGFINDRRLRVKILEATVHLLQESRGNAGPPSQIPACAQGTRRRHPCSDDPARRPRRRRRR